MLAKSVERSGNIQGPIRRNLWKAPTELTAGLTTILARQREDKKAQERREESAALARARAKWALEKQKLEAELGQLRVRVTLLEDNSSNRSPAGEAYTDEVV